MPRTHRTLALLVGVLLVASCSPPAAPASGGPRVPAPGSGAGAAAAAPADRPLERIRIGYPSRSVTFLSMLLAYDQGYYREQGLDAELTQMRTNVGITALLNGEVDYTESIGTNIRSALQGAPIKTILVNTRAPVFTLIARPEYATPAQLRGRTVGVTNFGGSNDQVTRLIFKHYGLDPQRDVQLIPVGDAPVQYEALRIGQLDAAVISLPFPLLSRQEGYRLLVNAPDIVSMPLGGMGALQSKLETQRDQAKRVVKGEIQGLRHIRAHPEDAIRLIAELFEMDEDTARQAYEFILPSVSEDGTVERRGIETILELEREEVRAGIPLTFEQVVDPSVVEEAQRELGLR